MSSLAAAQGVTLHRVRGLGRRVHLFHDLGALWTLWRMCRELRPEIVHTHTAKAGALGRLAAWLAGVPVRIHTFHGHVFHGYFGPWQTALFLAIERLLARITTRVVAISARQADELRHYLRLGTDRVTVVPLGLDLAHFVTADAEAARRRFREQVGAGNQVVVTMVGRLTAIKNHALAIRAFSKVVARVRDLLLVFVGGGEEEPALRALVRDLGVEHQVRFAGWWDDLEAVYYGSDVVALSSTNEGTPVCLIEALACGCPVIATNVGGVPDVLAEGELGLLVPAGNESAFARALERFADPLERATFAGRGRDLVLSKYSVRRLVADIEALYSALTWNRGSEPSQGRSRPDDLTRI
jgi:glycosyltransferase involved in cell wall biosynthesis